MKTYVNKQILHATIAILLLLCCAATAFGGIQTDIPENKSKLINLTNSAYRISIANPKIAEFLLLSPGQIQVNGLKTGSTNMIVWLKGEKKPIFFDINVIKDDTSINEKLRSMAPNDDITAYFVNDTVVLVGTATNEDTVRKAREIAGAYAPQSDIKLSVSEENGVKVTKTELSSRIVDHIVINQPNQILLQVKVAQIDKTSLKKLGISGLIKGQTAEGFMNLIGAPASTSSSTNKGIAGRLAALGSFDPLDAFTFGVSYFPAGIGAVINALSTKGLAKVLAQPNLLVKTGERGEFRAVSEIPYQVVTTSGGQTATSIEFKEVGIKLNFNPELLENGMIRLRIDPAEVSSITGTLAVNGYPIIDKRSAKTSVELKDGESLIIAGLLSEEAINTMSKVPILGDIPILGALFRSTQKDIKEKELVFFITPKLMKPIEQGVKTELPTDRHPTPEEEKELRWVPIP